MRGNNIENKKTIRVKYVLKQHTHILYSIRKCLDDQKSPCLYKVIKHMIPLSEKIINHDILFHLILEPHTSIY